LEETNVAKARELEKRPSSAKVNLTIKIDRDLLRKIRVLAAEKDTSISALVAEAIEQQSTESNRYEAARKRALVLMNAQSDSVWERDYTRDKLHER
jgi:predicted transcriptional regulator